MTNLIVLDIVIGLIFIYLLYSLLATIIQELLANKLCFRAKLLERAIIRMLEDGNEFDRRCGSGSALFKKTGNGEAIKSPSGQFYNHPLIKFLAEDKYRSKPSYITKETFSKVIVDLLRGDHVKPEDNIPALIRTSLDEGKLAWGNVQISEETLKYLQSIWIDAQEEVEPFKSILENWFDETMERCTGWYQKHTQVILLSIGFFIAVIFNVDTLKIVDKLENDPKLRNEIVQQAAAFNKAHPNLDIEMTNELVNNKKQLEIIVPFKTDSTNRQTVLKQSDSTTIAKYNALKAREKELTNKADSIIKGDINKVNGIIGMGLGSYSCKCGDWGSLFSSVLGWLITALALSLGAPFWFDLLNKLMKLRGSVNIPATDKNKKEDKPQAVKTNENAR